MSNFIEVVRLRTTCFYSPSHGLCLTKGLKRLERKSRSFGPDWGIGDDVQNVGPELAAKSIKNLMQCPDGVYWLKMANIKKDWESGHVDDWDYLLVPYEEPAKSVDRGGRMRE